MEQKTVDWTIRELNKKKSVISLNPEYQRNPVWKKKQKVLFIDTIVKNYPISSSWLFFEEEDGNIEVADGQQRTRTIIEFLNNEYSIPILTGDLVGHNRQKERDKFFSDLQKEQQEAILDYHICVLIVKGASPTVKADIFKRCNNGAILNKQEKRNATVSNLLIFLKEVATVSFFKKIASDKRFENVEVAEQMWRLYNQKTIVVLSADKLDEELIKQENYDKNSKEAEYFKSIIYLLNDIFNESKYPSLNKPMGVSLFWLFHELAKKYGIANLNSHKPMLRELYENFLKSDSYKEFNTGASREVKSITNRHEILMPFFDKLISETLKEIDKRRNFTREEREAAYKRDNGKCVADGQEVTFDDFQLDHKDPWSKGGATTLENAQTMCSYHNQQKSDKIV